MQQHVRPSLQLLLHLLWADFVLSALVTYNWEVTWVWKAPDGHGRPVIGINGSWPCPTIEAWLGDTIVVNLVNKLGNETTGIHFHGINQINSNVMDGAVGTNQCPLPPGYSMKYSFTANQPGTYWYHSHNMGQYPDGFRGPMVIHNPNDVYRGEYDKDEIITISDWYHDQAPTVVSQMLRPNNTRFLPPPPDALLVNEGNKGHICIEANTTYRMRIINFSALSPAFLLFNALQMQIIAVDGVTTEKQIANHIRIMPAQRWDVLVSVGSTVLQNYPFLVALDPNPDFTAVNATQPIAFPMNLTGQLVTDPEGRLDGHSATDRWFPQDDFLLVPHDKRPAFHPVSKHWELSFDYCTDANKYPRACFNNVTFINQKVPTLYSVGSLGKNNREISAYGPVGAFSVPFNEVLEIIINNHDNAIHPFHLHGHQFQIISRPKSHSGDWKGTHLVPATPIRRDTVAVYPKSHAVLRIIANNPGVFLLHCHVEWHVEMGLSATLIEAPELLQDVKIPQDHIDVCEAQGIPVAGNAAGHALWSNTDGFVTINPTSYIGALYTAHLTQTPSGTPTGAPTETPTEVPSETPSGIPAGTPSWFPSEIPSGTPVGTLVGTPEGTPWVTPAVTPAEVPAETPAEVPAETPAEVPAETPAEVPAETPAETPVDTPEEGTPEGTPTVYPTGTEETWTATIPTTSCISSL
ncbi:Cupredoxin [Xylariaceae sp. FL0594]|nr:Cupredoxin [Xylariaceae sp. FL0594]